MIELFKIKIQIFKLIKINIINLILDYLIPSTKTLFDLYYSIVLTMPSFKLLYNTLFF